MVSVKFASPTDFSNFPSSNIVIESVTVMPDATPDQAGRVVFNSKTNRLFVCTGTTWLMPATDSDNLNGQPGTFYLNRANGTGQAPASSISNLASTVKAYPLSDFAPATASFSAGGNKLTDLGLGTIPTDAVNKSQLDGVAAIANSAALGVAIKAPVLVAAIDDIPLTGLTAVDGVTPKAGDRVLATAQTNPVDNGIYVAATGAWGRAADSDGANQLSPGTLVADETKDLIWILTTEQAIVPGTSPQNWTRFLSTAATQAGVGLLLSNNTMTPDYTVLTRKFEFEIPAGSTSVNVTHNLNNPYPAISVFEKQSGAQVIVDYTSVSATTGVFTFGQAPTAGQYIATMIG